MDYLKYLQLQKPGYFILFSECVPPILSKMLCNDMELYTLYFVYIVCLGHIAGKNYLIGAWERGSGPLAVFIYIYKLTHKRFY